LVEWPKWIEDPEYAGPPGKVGPGELRVTHINHATILIQVDGVNILTDPVWSERASPFGWLGPKRIRAPGIALRDLPPVDIILISHDHYDHLDVATLRELTAGRQLPVLAGLGVGGLLQKHGIGNVTELDWWQQYEHNALKITFVPARHASGRGLFDRNKTLWGGFVIQSPGGNIYFAGDTAYGHFLADIRQRFKGFRLALLPVGHYKPRWMMHPVHMGPEDAVRTHRYLQARQSVGMHFGTFHGAGGHNAERFDEHEQDLHQALEKYKVPASEFWLLGFGEGRDVL
jgi:L-ascorbate metabolism protein UlaG (beta-lactamase superfamily)